MVVLFHAAGILAGLGSVTFAAFERPRGQTALGLAVGFVGMGWWLVLQAKGVAGISFTTQVALVLLAATCSLLVRRLRFLVALWAGALGALWAGFLEQQGLGLAISLSLAIGTLVTAMLCKARIAAFAPPRLRFEALLVVCSVGLVVAIGPGLVEGWHTASALNAGSSAWSDLAGGAAVTGGSWALVLGALSVVAGGLQACLKAQWRAR